MFIWDLLSSYIYNVICFYLFMLTMMTTSGTTTTITYRITLQKITKKKENQSK